MNRFLALAIAAVGVCVGIFLGLLGLSVSYGKRLITPVRRHDETIRVLAVTAHSGVSAVRLNRDADTVLPGARYSFHFDQGRGHARIGVILSQDDISVTRQLLGIDRGHLVRGTVGRINGWWFTSPEELGEPVEHVELETELGVAPCWLITPKESDGSTWAIHVHGRGAEREETLRGVRATNTLRAVSLVVSYRNDAGSPSSKDGKYGLGTNEWLDVESAIHFAVSRGATRIVLVGWSMGGTICLLTGEYSSFRDRIIGIVLDSPALDWLHLSKHHADLARLPTVSWKIARKLLRAVPRVFGLERAIDLDSLTAARFAARLRVPVLVHTSPHDAFVPDGPAAQFRAGAPNLVKWRRQTKGVHVRLWNIDPVSWENETVKFLSELL